MLIVAEGVHTSHELKPTITLCKLLCSVLIKWLPLARSTSWTFTWISRFRLNTVSVSRKWNSCETLFTPGTEFTISVFNLKFIKYCDWSSAGHRARSSRTQHEVHKMKARRYQNSYLLVYTLNNRLFHRIQEICLVVYVTVCRASLWCLLVIAMALCVVFFVVGPCRTCNTGVLISPYPDQAGNKLVYLTE